MTHIDTLPLKKPETQAEPTAKLNVVVQDGAILSLGPDATQRDHIDAMNSLLNDTYQRYARFNLPVPSYVFGVLDYTMGTTQLRIAKDPQKTVARLQYPGPSGLSEVLVFETRDTLAMQYAANSLLMRDGFMPHSMNDAEKRGFHHMAMITDAISTGEIKPSVWPGRYHKF